MGCIDEIMPVHGYNCAGYRLFVFKKFRRQIPVLIANITRMEKNYPAVEVQVSGYFIGALDGSNGKNFRDLLFQVPYKWLEIQHEKNEKCQKHRDCHHEDNTECIGGSVIVSRE